MVKLWKRSKRSVGGSLDDYAALLNSMIYNGNMYDLTGNPIQMTMDGSPAERITSSFQGYTQGMMQANGPVFSLMTVRALAFSAIELKWQNKATRDLFGDAALDVFEEPWTGGTTQDLLVRMIQDADLAGNSYWVRIDGETVRLRPDWVTIALVPRIVLQPKLRPDGSPGYDMVPTVVGYKRIGYQYEEGGIGNCKYPAIFRPGEVAHFAPTPDPMATYRGMSWLTPVVREIQADGQMTDHKSKFFKSAATPNMVFKVPEAVSKEAFIELRDEFYKGYTGVENAYKPLFVGGGADTTVVGLNFEQMSFKVVQGAGESRLASAAGVPPIIAGFSEGLASGTYSNYASARRRFADGTVHPLWQNAVGSLATLAAAPAGTRLWYDSRHIPFLREDAADAADIERVKASTIRLYTDAGFTPESAVTAVDVQDITRLKHSGLFSVQLWPPGKFAGSPSTTVDQNSPIDQGADDTTPSVSASKKKRELGRDESQLEIGPGHALWEYWTKGEGLAKWSGAVHKWTTLHALLESEGVPPGESDGLTTNIIEHVFPDYMKTHGGKKA